MGRFYGKFGFAQTEETSPGIWTESIIERNYYGDVTRRAWRNNQGEGVNDNLMINNEISIVADPFALDNFNRMSYVEWHGSLWKISGVEVQYPRLLLSLGGVYNGTTPETA